MPKNTMQNVQPINPARLNAKCLGVVLAGGLSSRMGENKAKLMRNNLNMLEYSKALLGKTGVDNVVVSGGHYGSTNSDKTNFDKAILEGACFEGASFENTNAIADQFNKIGPLGGIISVINTLRPQAILVMPVDLPLIDHQSLLKLKQIGEVSQKACYYEDNFLPLYLPVNAYTEKFINQQNIALASASTQTSSIKALHNNEQRNKAQTAKSMKGPSVKRLLTSVPSLAVKADHPEHLFNTNTQQEWQQARAIFSTNTSFTK